MCIHAILITALNFMLILGITLQIRNRIVFSATMAQLEIVKQLSLKALRNGKNPAALWSLLESCGTYNQMMWNWAAWTPGRLFRHFEERLAECIEGLEDIGEANS